MWWQGQQQFHNVTSPRNGTHDPDAHAHSPRHRQASKANADARAQIGMGPAHMSQGLMAHPAFRPHGSREENAFWSQHGPMHDPFTGAPTPNSFYRSVAARGQMPSGGVATANQSRSTSTSHDESMPDYSRPLSPASSRRSYPMPDYSLPPTLPGSRQGSGFASSALDEVGFSQLESMLHSHHDPEIESQFNDMMAAISPRKHSSMSGISAPSNTRVNSAVNTPTVPSHSISAAAHDRVSSYNGLPRAVSVTTRDPPPRIDNATSGVLWKSPDLPSNLSSDVTYDMADKKGQHENLIKKIPASNPKGRKEGRASESDGLDVPSNKLQPKTSTTSLGRQGKENNKKLDEKISDGKRKRSSKISGTKVTLEDRLANPDNSSPLRKTSRTGISPSKTLINLDDLTAEGVVSRTPLAELDNRS